MGKITSLFHRISAALPFRRKKSAAGETNESESGTTANEQEIQDLDKTLVSERKAPAPEEASAESDDETEAKPGFMSRISARIGQLFVRRSIVSVDENSSEDTLTSAKSSAKDEESEAAPRKRRIPIKKLLILALPALVIIIILAVTAVMFIRSNTQHNKAIALEEKHKKELESEFKKLQEKTNALLEENKKLRSTSPQTAPVSTPQEIPSKPAVNPPSADPKPVANNNPAVNIGDCSVTNKASAGDSLKRCIDAYNAATGR